MESEKSGVEVTNYIRHTLNDDRTRILLITDHPEKVPKGLLTREYDINGYMEKSSINERTMFIQIRALINVYKDIVTFENAIKNMEKTLTPEFQNKIRRSSV